MNSEKNTVLVLMLIHFISNDSGLLKAIQLTNAHRVRLDKDHENVGLAIHT